MYYVPKFVKQVSDLEYGSVVTHENYNEKLNLNMEQGDYNTEVLRILFTEQDIDKTYRVPYLEKYTDDAVATIKNEIKEHVEQIDKNKKNIERNLGYIRENESDIRDIIDGTTPVRRAYIANTLDGVQYADNHTYYGKDYKGSIGFHAVPDSIYAEDISSSTAEINGIYYVPRTDSVEEHMLTEEVRAKLNRTSISSYNDLTDKPKINGVLLQANTTLSELGIQPAGNYLTEIPEQYPTSSDVASLYLNKTDASVTYISKYEHAILANTVVTLSDQVTNAPYNRVCIGEFTGTPKTGDLLIDL